MCCCLCTCPELYMDYSTQEWAMNPLQNRIKIMYVLPCLFCSCCSSGVTADNYETNLRSALEVIRQNIPRVFVNLVPMGNLSEVNMSVVIIGNINFSYTTGINFNACNYTFHAKYRSYTGSQLSGQSTV